MKAIFISNISLTLVCKLPVYDWPSPLKHKTILIPISDSENNHDHFNDLPFDSIIQSLTTGLKIRNSSQSLSTIFSAFRSDFSLTIILKVFAHLTDSTFEYPPLTIRSR